MLSELRSYIYITIRNTLPAERYYIKFKYYDVYIILYTNYNGSKKKPTPQQKNKQCHFKMGPKTNSTAAIFFMLRLIIKVNG